MVDGALTARYRRREEGEAASMLGHREAGGALA